MAVRTKYQLPCYYRLRRVSFDPVRLKQEALRLSGEFTNVLESNKRFCAHNHELAKSVYDHYEQVSLTDFRDEQNEPSLEECSSFLGQAMAVSEKAPGRFGRYRFKRAEMEKIPELNEFNYDKPTELLKGSYIEECLRSFRSRPTRVRLIKLKAGQTLPPHIDYDPSYAVRILIPVVSSPQCLNISWRRNEPIAVHMPADGGAWFLNPGFLHSAVNLGAQDRVTLMVTLKDQSDLDEIPADPAQWNGL